MSGEVELVAMLIKTHHVCEVNGPIIEERLQLFQEGLGLLRFREEWR